MKIAVAGKGGSGKTTIAGTLARLLARNGSNVVAIDADSNPNLGITLGLPRDSYASIPPLTRDIVDRERKILTISTDDILKRFSVDTPDHVKLLLMGRVEHAAAG